MLSRVLGWSFLAVASLLVTRPDGVVGRPFREWRLAEARKENVKTLWPILAGRRTIGGRSSDLVVVANSFECSFCKDFSDSLDLMNRDARAPRLLIITKVDPRDSLAVQAALIVECAAQRGGDVQVFKAIMKGTGKVSPRTVDSLLVSTPTLADEEGARCLHARETKELVEGNQQILRKLQLNLTPSFVNSAGQMIKGIKPISQIIEFAR